MGNDDLIEKHGSKLLRKMLQIRDKSIVRHCAKIEITYKTVRKASNYYSTTSVTMLGCNLVVDSTEKMQQYAEKTLQICKNRLV